MKNLGIAKATKIFIYAIIMIIGIVLASHNLVFSQSCAYLIGANPTSLTINPGFSDITTITAWDNCSHQLDLLCVSSNLPSYSCSFSLNPISSGSNSILNISIPYNINPDTYYVEIEAKDINTGNYALYNLTINVIPGSSTIIFNQYLIYNNIKENAGTFILFPYLFNQSILQIIITNNGTRYFNNLTIVLKEDGDSLIMYYNGSKINNNITNIVVGPVYPYQNITLNVTLIHSVIYKQEISALAVELYDEYGNLVGLQMYFLSVESSSDVYFIIVIQVVVYLLSIISILILLKRLKK